MHACTTIEVGDQNSTDDDMHYLYFADFQIWFDDDITDMLSLVLIKKKKRKKKIKQSYIWPMIKSIWNYTRLNLKSWWHAYHLNPRTYLVILNSHTSNMISKLIKSWIKWLIYNVDFEMEKVMNKVNYLMAIKPIDLKIFNEYLWWNSIYLPIHAE